MSLYRCSLVIHFLKKELVLRPSLSWAPQLAAGGDDGIRTHDPLLAGQVLSQLSYTPIIMGLRISSLWLSPSFFQDQGTVLSVPFCPVSALSYFPVQSPVKYLHHCRA